MKVASISLVKQRFQGLQRLFCSGQIYIPQEGTTTLQKKAPDKTAGGSMTSTLLDSTMKKLCVVANVAIGEATDGRLRKTLF
ncbi:hypothetical protein D0962_07700 [Leptolyngbyaceae cyanobacterium CCMR0082]|uniref:Uncharacterized protein n=1 Tax=Adonisia turfae CCMR0082 TaxID=2304604 RepID=A0A6M0S2N5_9CYAN|nr:hypothetical protein [Adonisia turfae CCMR0082]